MANESTTKPSYEEPFVTLSYGGTFTAKNVEDLIRGFGAELNTAQSELARVRGLLQRHGKHEFRCLWETPPNDLRPWEPHKECTCGLLAGAESADIGKLDTADKSGVEMGKVNRVDEKEFKERRKGWEWRTGGGQAKGYIAESGDGLLHAERRKSEKVSAETGGEKAAPDYENDPAHKQCVGFSDWNALLYEICKFYAKIDPEWADADISHMNEFDPWEALRKLQANFRRSSQNQTVSSGVEGAHEGTTADKNVESREPEKLNNAHKAEKELSCAKCGLHKNHGVHRSGAVEHLWPPTHQFESKVRLAESSLSQKCAKCPYDDRDPIHSNRKFPNYHKFESSLSSPPPLCNKIIQLSEDDFFCCQLEAGHYGYHSNAASPELLPTQPPARGFCIGVRCPGCAQCQ